MNQGEHLIMVARLNEGPDAFRDNLEVDDLVALPVHVRACLVVFRAEVLPEEGQETFIAEDSEEWVRGERLLVDVDRYSDS